MAGPGKLVRDGIPEILRGSGLDPVVHQADPAEYRRRLRDKLQEEVEEFLTAGEDSAVEELADVLEVVHALAADLGVGPADLGSAAAEKAARRGAFEGRWVWTGNRASESVDA